MNLNETPEGYKQYYLFDHPVKDPKEFEKAAPYNNALRVSLQNIPNAAGKTFYMYTAAKNPRLAGVVNVTKQDNGICEFDFVPQTKEDSEVTPYKNEKPLAEGAVKWEVKGKPVPKICPKCGSKVGIFLHGEPIFQCTNKGCKKVFGVVPFTNEAAMEESASFNDVKKIVDTLSDNDLYFITHGGEFKNSPYAKYRDTIGNKGFVEVYAFDDAPNTGVLVYGVSPKFRGQGVGRRLLKLVDKNCPRLGIRKIVARADANNAHSQKVLQDSGYVMVKKSSDQIRYEKILSKKMDENALTASGRRPKNFKEEETNPATLESMIEFAKSHGMTPIIEEYEDEELDESMDFEKTYKLKSTPTTWDDFKTYWMEKRKIFRSNIWDDREVSKEEFVVYQQSYDIMCKPDVDYEQYKDAFDRFCVLFDILSETTIIENLHFESEDNEYRILMRYSTGTVKVRIPDDIDLLHVSPAKDIDILIPTFKSKTEGKYFYPNKRVYFTVGNKRIPSKKSGLEDTKVYRYEPTEHISEAYIDPTYTQFSVGAVFVRTENPIDVEVQTKLSKMNEAVEKKRTKEDVLKDHLKINAMAYNGILYIPEYMESIKKLYGYPIFDFFYPSLKIFTLQSRKATSLGGLWNGTQYNAKTNWYKASVNDQNHVQFAKEVGTLLDKILSGSMIEPGDLDIATEWLDEVEYHHSLLNEAEPYSSKYFYECQYLHDLFWDPFDDPRDSGVIAQNIVSVVRQIVPEVFGNINEHDGLVTKQSLQKYLADEISDKSIFLLPDKKLYPVLDKTSLKLAMDSILQVADSDKKEFVKNLNAKMKENGYPYNIPIDHPYAKYAPKEIIIPVMMMEGVR